MFDAKVITELTSTSCGAVCFICGAKPSEMDDIANEKPIKTENLRYGISSLHYLINTFECCLHIGYRQNIKTWQVRGAEKQAVLDAEKKRIQSEFKSKMGLLVDVPKSGFATTNDGNTARRFFCEPSVELGNHWG